MHRSWEGSLARARLPSTGPSEPTQPRPLSNLLSTPSLSIRSSDSEEAFETPESTTPVKAPPAPPPPPSEVIPEPEVSAPPPPEEPGNQGSGAPGGGLGTALRLSPRKTQQRLRRGPGWRRAHTPGGWSSLDCHQPLGPLSSGLDLMWCKLRVRRYSGLFCVRFAEV